MATFISHSPAETEAFGCQFAKALRAGQVLALKGELGAGKTKFVKGLVAGLDGAVEVTSPTFTLIHEYGGGRLTIYHLDFFRIEDEQSAERLGLDDCFFGDGISVVEWADKFEDVIPQNAIWITFETTSEHERRITYQGLAASRRPSKRRPAAAGENAAC